MGEVIKKHIEPKQVSMHEFYCDNCNKWIGTSFEYEDGWYQKYGEYKISFIEKKYCFNKTLCDICAKQTNKDIQKMLISYGFKEENNGG